MYKIDAKKTQTRAQKPATDKKNDDIGDDDDDDVDNEIHSTLKHHRKRNETWQIFNQWIKRENFILITYLSATWSTGVNVVATLHFILFFFVWKMLKMLNCERCVRYHNVFWLNLWQQHRKHHCQTTNAICICLFWCVSLKMSRDQRRNLLFSNEWKWKLWLCRCRLGFEDVFSSFVVRRSSLWRRQFEWKWFALLILYETACVLHRRRVAVNNCNFFGLSKQRAEERCCDKGTNKDENQLHTHFMFVLRNSRNKNLGNLLWRWTSFPSRNCRRCRRRTHCRLRRTTDDNIDDGGNDAFLSQLIWYS